MKFVLILLLFLSKVTLAGDTLKFGNKSYPLHKVPTYFNTDDYDAHVSIPSEYTKVENKLKIKIKKNFKERYINIKEEFLPDGTFVIVTSPGRINSLSIDTLYNNITLNYFTDTIYLKKEDLKDFKPYIKTKTNFLFFYDFHLISINNGLKTNYIIKNYTSAQPFEAIKSYEFDLGTQFIMDELYYRKKDAVYKLNYQFIIIIK